MRRWSTVIFTMIWKIRKLAWSLDDFVLASISYADDVVLVPVSVTAAEVMVIAKLKEVGLTVGAQKTHWTNYPEMVDKSIMVDGRKSWSLWDQRCAWTGMQDMRSHTDQPKPANVWQSGDLF